MKNTPLAVLFSTSPEREPDLGIGIDNRVDQGLPMRNCLPDAAPVSYWEQLSHRGTIRSDASSLVASFALNL